METISPMKSSELSNGKNRIALWQLLQKRKVHHLWHHNLGSRRKLQKMAQDNFCIGAFYNITKNQDNPIKTVGRDSFLSPKTPKIQVFWGSPSPQGSHSPYILGDTTRPRHNICPSLIEIGSNTAEKNSAQTNRQTNRHYENNGHLAVNQNLAGGGMLQIMALLYICIRLSHCRYCEHFMVWSVFWLFALHGRYTT